MTYLLVLLILVGLYAILASSFSLVIGHAGLISIARPAFFAIGAYASGLLARDGGWPPLAAAPAAALLAAAGSILVSLPALRASGDYLMIASLGFQLGLVEAIKNLSFAGGSGGLTNTPPLFGGQAGAGGYAALVLLSSAAVVWLIRRIMRSDYGRAVSALRDDEAAAAMLGRDPVWIKRRPGGRPAVRAAEAGRRCACADGRRALPAAGRADGGRGRPGLRRHAARVRDVAATGVAVAVVEHNVGFIRDLCDEGVLMFASRILARGGVEELVKDRRLTELYFDT